jgi:hypothetical protein
MVIRVRGLLSRGAGLEGGDRGGEGACVHGGEQVVGAVDDHRPLGPWREIAGVRQRTLHVAMAKGSPESDHVDPIAQALYGVAAPQGSAAGFLRDPGRLRGAADDALQGARADRLGLTTAAEDRLGSLAETGFRLRKASVVVEGRPPRPCAAGEGDQGKGRGSRPFP